MLLWSSFGSSSLATLEDLDWLPLNHTFSTVSENVLNVTIWMLTFLQEHGVATTGMCAQELVRNFKRSPGYLYDSHRRAKMLFKKDGLMNMSNVKRNPLFFLIKERNRLKIWNSNLNLIFYHY